MVVFILQTGWISLNPVKYIDIKLAFSNAVNKIIFTKVQLINLQLWTSQQNQNQLHFVNSNHTNAQNMHKTQRCLQTKDEKICVCKCAHFLLRGFDIVVFKYFWRMSFIYWYISSSSSNLSDVKTDKSTLHSERHL